MIVTDMPTRYTVVCDDDLSRHVSKLARKYELTHEEVLRQLAELGLDELEKAHEEDPTV